MKVYEKVRAYIERREVSLSHLEASTGIPAAKLKAMLSGKRTMQIDDFREICIGLNVSPDMFIEYKSAQCLTQAII